MLGEQQRAGADHVDAAESVTPTVLKCRLLRYS
jgi:hypothetical protein